MTEIEQRECALIQATHALAELSLEPLTAETGAAMAKLAGQVSAVAELPTSEEQSVG